MIYNVKPLARSYPQDAGSLSPPGAPHAWWGQADREEQLMDHLHVNDVSLVGRITAEPLCKPLPSGAELVQWRMFVKRPPEKWHGLTTGDSVPCISFDPTFHELVAGWRRGDLVEVRGALRRRVWRTPEGAMASRYDVEVSDVGLMVPRAAPERTSASPGRP
jgi:single-stranded DNA-binding protein